MKIGQPNLSEVERRRSQGVAVLYYTDGDYRCRWFTPQWFTDNEDEWWEVDAERVIDEFVPAFQAGTAKLRLEPGEPQQAGFEVYWGGELAHWERVAPYTPVPLE